LGGGDSGARGVTDPDLDPVLFRLGEAKTLEPGRARRASAGRIDHEIGRDAVLVAVTDPDAHTLDRRPDIVGDQLMYGTIVDHAHIRQSHQAPAHVAFQHRPGRQQSDEIARSRFDGDAMADPVHVACDIAAGAAAGDDLVGPAREEILDHVPAPRQQAMRMAPLRHALARNVRLRKRIALQHGDDGVEIRQRASGQQTAHAGADHNGMLTNMFHRNTPDRFACRRRVFAGTGK